MPEYDVLKVYTIEKINFLGTRKMTMIPGDLIKKEDVLKYLGIQIPVEKNDN